jgi:hypothetical protein
MMKNNKILIALVFVLIAVSAIIYIKTNGVNQGTIDSIKGAKSDFAIKDTASISKIFITDAKGGKVTLTRGDDEWIVDGKYVARPDNIRILMKTFSRIDVRSPVPKAAFNNVVKQIATGAIKVEIYQGEEKPSKTYYVGGATLDHQGTYMVLETEGVKSTTPFVMYIPGNYGYLTTRFFTEPAQWRDAVVFRYLPEEIKSIEINYFEKPAASFAINRINNQFTLSNIGSLEIIPIDTMILNEYVNRYRKIYYEMIDIDSPQEKIDSTIASSPFISIEVKDVEGVSNKIVIYHMPNFRKITDPITTEVYDFDVDRMYGYLNDELFTYVQFATFDNITLPKKYFTNSQFSLKNN